MEYNSKIFIQLLEEIRLQKSISKYSISKKTNLSEMTIKRTLEMETEPSLSNFLAIAKALGLHFYFESKNSETDLNKCIENAKEKIDRKNNYVGDGMGLHTEDREVYNTEKKTTEDLENLIKAPLYIETLLEKIYKDKSKDDFDERKLRILQAWDSLLENDPQGAVNMSSYLFKSMRKFNK